MIVHSPNSALFTNSKTFVDIEYRKLRNPQTTYIEKHKLQVNSEIISLYILRIPHYLQILKHSTNFKTFIYPNNLNRKTQAASKRAKQQITCSPKIQTLPIAEDQFKPIHTE